MEKFLVAQFLRDQGFDDPKQAQLTGALEDWVHVLATLKALTPRFIRIMAALEMVSETVHDKVAR